MVLSQLMDNPAWTATLLVSMRNHQQISPQLKKHRLQQIQTVIEETSELSHRQRRGRVSVVVIRQRLPQPSAPTWH